MSVGTIWVNSQNRVRSLSKLPFSVSLLIGAPPPHTAKYSQVRRQASTPALNVQRHPLHRWACRHFRQAVRVDVADDEVAVLGVAHAESSGRNSTRRRCTPRSACRRGDLPVVDLGFLGAQNARQHPVDLANEGEPVALPRAAPKPLEERVEALPQVACREQAGGVVAFRFLDVEADLIDRLAEVEFDQRIGIVQAASDSTVMTWNGTPCSRSRRIPAIVRSNVPRPERVSRCASCRCRGPSMLTPIPT